MEVSRPEHAVEDREGAAVGGLPLVKGAVVFAEHAQRVQRPGSLLGLLTDPLLGLAKRPFEDRASLCVAAAATQQVPQPDDRLDEQQVDSRMVDVNRFHGRDRAPKRLLGGPEVAAHLERRGESQEGGDMVGMPLADFASHHGDGAPCQPLGTRQASRGERLLGTLVHEAGGVDRIAAWFVSHRSPLLIHIKAPDP